MTDATTEMRPILEQQLEALRGIQTMLASAEASMPAVNVPELSAEGRAFFTPLPPAAVPSWVPDTLTRVQVTEELMRCPDGATIYADESNVGCALPSGPGRIALQHGLQLAFSRSTGRLSSQRYYEQKRLRWSIDYHASDGRASVGFYGSTEPYVYTEEGLHTEFAPNGTIVSQSSWRAGVKEGWTKMWEDDGTPIGATLYEGGRAVEEVMGDGQRHRIAVSANSVGVAESPSGPLPLCANVRETAAPLEISVEGEKAGASGYGWRKRRS